MKSAYYAAVVTNTYKMAIDSYFSEKYEYNEMWYRELLSVSHRDYATGYYFDDCRNEANISETPGYIKEKAYLATVIGYDSEREEAILSQRNKMSVGDKAEVLTPGKVGEPIEISELYDENLNPIESAPHPYMTFRMRVKFPLKAGDIIRGC
jgi:putative protease